MMKMILIASTFLLLSACGTVATPVYEAPQPAVDAGEAVTQVAQPATATVQPPTATPEPPTPTPTEIPTEEPVEDEATETEEAEDATDTETIDDPLAFVIENLSDASNGEVLFSSIQDTPTGQWACTNCHLINSEDMLIGPGLLNIFETAKTRVEGEGPYTYIYNSIRYADIFIVEGYEFGLQMPNYDGILTDGQIYDLVAYLVTLRDE